MRVNAFAEDLILRGMRTCASRRTKATRDEHEHSCHRAGENSSSGAGSPYQSDAGGARWGARQRTRPRRSTDGRKWMRSLGTSTSEPSLFEPTFSWMKLPKLPITAGPEWLGRRNYKSMPANGFCLEWCRGWREGKAKGWTRYLLSFSL